VTDTLGWLGPAYPWVKALHLAFVIFWMAGLFTLPRYLAHQAAETPGGTEDRKWSDRTARLRRVILTPSLVIVWALGLALLAEIGLGDNAWLHAKLVLVVLLTGYHGWMARMARRMAIGARPMPERRLRIWNEVPAFFVLAIVTLAIVKPF
jgi:putative membrane protein